MNLIDSTIYSKDYPKESFKAQSDAFITADPQTLGVGPSELGIALIDYSLSKYPEYTDETLLQAGSFFGECLVASMNGRWIFDSNWSKWCVVVDSGNDKAVINVFKKIDERLRGEALISQYYKMFLAMKARSFNFPKESGILPPVSIDYGAYISKFAVSDSIQIYTNDPVNFPKNIIALLGKESPELVIWLADYVDKKIPNDPFAIYYFNLGACIIYFAFEAELKVYACGQFKKAPITKKAIKQYISKVKTWGDITSIYKNFEKTEPYLYKWMEDMRKIIASSQKENRDKYKNEDLFMYSAISVYFMCSHAYGMVKSNEKNNLSQSA